MNSQLAAPISEDRPLVSIIIPHRHQHSWLQRCLLMCCQQSYSNIEIIIVDDCSEELPENHLNISDPRIRFIRTRSQIGPAGARNLGFKASTGQFIQFLDCDDHIHSKKIECQVQTLISNQGHVVLSNWRSAARLFGFDFLFPTSQLPDNEELLNETVGDSEKWFPIMCGLFSREFLAEVGPWNEGLEWNEDRDYRYRILKMKPLILRAPGNFFIYRRHNSPSRNTQFNVTPRGRDIIARTNQSFIKMVERDIAQGFVSGDEVADGLRQAKQRMADLSQVQVLGVEGKFYILSFYSRVKVSLKTLISADAAYGMSATFGLLKSWIKSWSIYIFFKVRKFDSKRT